LIAGVFYIDIFSCTAAERSGNAANVIHHRSRYSGLWVADERKAKQICPVYHCRKYERRLFAVSILAGMGMGRKSRIFNQETGKERQFDMGMPFSDKKEKNEPESKPNNPDIDPEIWYNIQGKKVIEACVADLNSRGHANLYIKEDGAICFHQEGAEVVTDRISKPAYPLE
jgi:hypothetical protein